MPRKSVTAQAPAPKKAKKSDAGKKTSRPAAKPKVAQPKRLDEEDVIEEGSFIESDFDEDSEGSFIEEGDESEADGPSEGSFIDEGEDSEADDVEIVKKALQKPAETKPKKESKVEKEAAPKATSKSTLKSKTPVEAKSDAQPEQQPPTDAPAPPTAPVDLGPDPVFESKIDYSKIKNKMTRARLLQAEREERDKFRREKREKRKREAEDPQQPKVKRAPKTIESKREFDETVVDPADEEVVQDEATDELASYFDGTPPRVLITTSTNAEKAAIDFAVELKKLIPKSKFFRRKRFPMKTVIAEAIEHKFTDVIVINEDKTKGANGMLISHLPNGPTATFRLSNIKYPKEIANHGVPTKHLPEVIINNFHTRLGHQVGRQLTALFPQLPQFVGRNVVTFHNQRDFIFFRRHRYIFKDHKKVALQELGPRFTLKLRKLQVGPYDGKFGEYEWVHKPDMDTSRARFFL